ncbi:MAG: helix-turn-helix transcriptional regulator [bacterium]|nr:helix-turn-helix transcriptional regulator [bacterium]
MTIGKRLKSLRKLKGLSQNEVARRAGINRPTISELESGQQHDVTVKTARVLRVRSKCR